jgi:nitrite reductase/ring-hydroxylating ferredoxin subunit
MARPAWRPPDASTTSLALARSRALARLAMRRIDLLGVDEVADGEMKMAWVDGTDQVLVINIGGEVTAVQGVCSHEYFELDKGFLTNGTLTCALHLSRFDLVNGEPLDPPAEEPLAVYPVVIEDGRILIEVPDGPLEISES